MHSPPTTLLLLPGLEGSGELYAPLVDELATDFDTRVVRYPNSCGSYASAGEVVREALPPDCPLVLVAESFSTPLAVQIAAELPDAIGALILCNGFVTNPLSAFESMWASATAPWFFHFPLTAIAARTFLVGPDAPDALIDAVRSAIAPVPATALCARLNAILRCDAREALRRITAPVLYLHATRDRLIGEAGLNQIQRVKPDLAVERIPGPHLLFQREPRACADRIRSFVQRAVTSPAAAKP